MDRIIKRNDVITPYYPILALLSVKWLLRGGKKQKIKPGPQKWGEKGGG